MNRSYASSWSTRIGTATALVMLSSSIGLLSGPGFAAANAAGACSVGVVGSAPEVPSVNAEPRTTEWYQQYARAERVQVGLDSSDAAIATAAADPDATSDQLGSPITPAEAANLANQRAVSDLVDTVVKAAATLGLSNVVNAAVDPADRTLIDVVISDSNCGVIGLLRSFAPGVNLAAVHVDGAVSQAASILLNDTLGANMVSLWDKGTKVANSDVDPISGRLEVHLDPSSSGDAAEVISSIVGKTGVDIFYDGKPATTAATRINSPLSPLRAGEDITDGSERCTSNFDAYNAASHYFLITAGHCWTNPNASVSMNSATSSGDLWHYDASKRLGTPNGAPVYNGATVSCDCEAIGPVAGSSATNNELVGPLTGATVRNFYFVAYSSSKFENSPQVCLSGISEAAAYGQIICGSISNAHMNNTVCSPGCALQYVTTDTFSVNMPSGTPAIAGDSGGPGCTGGDTLMGVMSATSGSTAYMTKARNLQSIYPNMDWSGLSHV